MSLGITWDPSLRVSDPGALAGAWECAFETSSQVLLLMVLYTEHSVMMLMDPWSREEEEEEGEEEMGEEEEKGQQGKIPEARGSLVLGHTRPEPRVREAGKEGAVHRRFGWWLQWLT